MHENVELELIKRAQNGDKGSFETLYHRYKNIIFNYLCKMLNNAALAEDIMQATFIKAYLNIGMYKPTGTFSSWLYAIARNLARNELRRPHMKRNVSLEASVGEEGNLEFEDLMRDKNYDDEAFLGKLDTQELINSVLEAMPPQYREIIVLCFVQGHSYEEAAKILNTSVAAVANKIYRAREYFIRLVKEAREKK